MKNLRCIFIIFLLSFISFQVFAQYDANAKKALDKAKNRYQALKAFEISFTANMQNLSNGATESFSGTIAVQGNKYRLNVKGQEIINNGKTVWTYLKDDNEVNISDYEPEEDEITPDKIFTLYQKGFKYAIENPNVNIKGKQYDNVVLTPEDKNLSYFKINLYIKKNAGKESGAIKKWEIHERNGTIYTYTVTKLIKNPRKVLTNSKYFSFEKSKYPGVDVVDLR